MPVLPTQPVCKFCAVYNLRFASLHGMKGVPPRIVPSVRSLRTSPRLVDRRLPRGRHRLGHRRLRGRYLPSHLPLRKTRKGSRAALSQISQNWGKMRRTIVAYNGFFFNTNRMVKHYIRNAYEPTIRTKGGSSALSVSKYGSSRLYL